MKKRLLLIVLTIMAVISGAFALTACGEQVKDVVDGILDGAKTEVEPQNVAYDGEYVTWDKADCLNYTISINGGEAVKVNSTTYLYKSNAIVEVVVSAVYEKSTKSTSVTFNPLATIEELTVSDNGEVSWAEVPGANAYLVSIGSKTQIVTDTKLDPTYLTAAKANSVKVKPVVTGDKSFYSQYSKAVSVYICSAPSNVKYNEGLLTWVGGGNSGYEVTINNEKQTVSGNLLEYASDNRDFTVSIKSLGNHTTTYDSQVVSDSFHYLDAVTTITVKDGIVIWDGIANAEGYKIKLNGIEQQTTVTDTRYDGLSSGISYEVSVKPYNSNGNYFSTYSLSKKVHLLEAPALQWSNDIAPNGEERNNIIWNAVSAAEGYTVRVIKDNGTPDETTNGAKLSFLYGFASVGTYVVQVKANATSAGSDYYDSKYSAPITVKRLAGPRPVTENFIVSDKDNVAAGFTVNYLAVEGASSYKLYKDGVELSAEGASSTGLSVRDLRVVDGKSNTEQRFTYKVRSMGGKTTKNGNDYITLPCLLDGTEGSSALSFEIVVQATPRNLKMSGTTLSWDPVVGSAGYTVSYAGIPHTANGATYDLSKIEAGHCSVNVTAQGDGRAVLASNPSGPVEIERLRAPENIRITSAGGGTLTYSKVSNANSYEAYLGGEQTPIDSNVFGSMHKLISTAGTTLVMSSVANYYNDMKTLYYMSSNVSPVKQFIRLKAPQFPEGAAANSVELTWNPPANINTQEYMLTYKLFSAIDNQIGGASFTSNKYNIANLASGSHKFYVKAIGDGERYVDSDYSDVLSVYKLEAPTVKVNRVDGKYEWKSVTNATSYYLEIDGEKVSDALQKAGETYSYAPRFTTAGKHTVKLQAIGDKRGNLNSKVTEITQQVAMLRMPEISFRYSDEAFVKNGSIIVTVTTPSENCSGYQYEIGGVSSGLVAGLEHSKVIESPGPYSVKVKALGNSFDENGVFYIDSNYVGGSENDYIHILAAPNLTSLVITDEGQIKWNEISYATGYEYQLSIDGGEFSAITVEKNAQFSVADYVNGKRVTIKIRAKGDGNKTVSSAWVEKTFE